MAICRELASAIEGDAGVANFCTSNFGKNIKMYIGIDDEAKPEESDMPFIAFRPGDYSPNIDQEKRNETIFFSLCLKSEGYTISGSTITMNGLGVLESLYFEIERVIMAYCTTNKFIGAASIAGLNTEIAYPLFRVSGQISFQEDYL